MVTHKKSCCVWMGYILVCLFYDTLIYSHLGVSSPRVLSSAHSHRTNNGNTSKQRLDSILSLAINPTPRLEHGRLHNVDIVLCVICNWKPALWIILITFFSLFRSTTILMNMLMGFYCKQNTAEKIYQKNDGRIPTNFHWFFNIPKYMNENIFSIFYINIESASVLIPLRQQ